MTAFEHAHGGEEADAGTERGSADVEAAGEFTLRREAISGFKDAGGDEGANVVDDLHGELTVSADGVGLFVLQGRPPKVII